MRAVSMRTVAVWAVVVTTRRCNAQAWEQGDRHSRKPHRRKPLFLTTSGKSSSIHICQGISTNVPRKTEDGSRTNLTAPL